MTQFLIGRSLLCPEEMYLLVHTMVASAGRLEVVVVLCHGLTATPDRRIKSEVLAKRLRIKRLNTREKYPRLRYHIKALKLRTQHSSDKKKLRVLSGVPTKEEHVVPNLSPYSLNETQPPSYLGVANWTPEETATWLSCQRFQAHLATLGSYSGADLLRLSRDQFVQLIGLADGLRLYNALHSPAPPPARTIYVTADGRFHRPLYLSVTTKSELRCRLASAFSLHSLTSVVIAGPAGIRILVSDELVQHIPDHSAFTVQLLPGESGDGTSIQALLIPSNSQIT